MKMRKTKNFLLLILALTFFFGGSIAILFSLVLANLWLSLAGLVALLFTWIVAFFIDKPMEHKFRDPPVSTPPDNDSTNTSSNNNDDGPPYQYYDGDTAPYGRY